MAKSMLKQPSGFKKKLKKSLKEYWQIYLLVIPVIAWFVIFAYYPMYGVVVAFKDYLPSKGILNSEWVGWKHFEYIFKMPGFTNALKNTIIISLLKLVCVFPFPIILSLFLNEVKSPTLKKSIQTMIYLPYFISWVVLAGIMYNLLSVNGGLINNLLVSMGKPRKSFMTDPNYFYLILIIAEIWKGAGWGTVIYISGMAGINTDLYEAAEIDGCGRFKKMAHVTLPALLPIIVMMFIIQVGNIMNAGFDPIFNLYNMSVESVADILDTFAYTIGISKGYAERGAALGLFKAIINFVLMIAANALVKKLTGQGIYSNE